jgi:hypothetical protein
MSQQDRRGFLKMLSMAALACALPEPTKRLTLSPTTSNADMRIGVESVERMRITSSGYIMIHSRIDSGTKLCI